MEAPHVPETADGLSAAPAAVSDPRARRGVRHRLTYDEGRSQIRTGTGAQVMAVLRNAATVV
jgi:hypothetical protein